MKVSFVINSLKYPSGTERVACILANLFSTELNIKVTIYNRDTESNQVAYPIDPLVKIIPLSGNLLKFRKKLYNAVEVDNPDILIIHNMGKLSLFCSLINFNKSIEIISLEHVAFESRPWMVQKVSKFLYKRKIDKVVSITDIDKRNYDSFHKKVYCINNISPFPISKSPYKLDSKVIIAVGRLEDQKNFSDLIYAWHKISKDIDGWSLLIYGEGSERDKLTNLIDKCKISNIYLKGNVKNISSIYEEASFFVMSSKFEGLPMVLLEAQAFGLPIVSYDCPHGPSTIVKDGLNGILVDNQNVNKLAEGILELINNDNKRAIMSQVMKKNANIYSSEYILNQWRELINI